MGPLFTFINKGKCYKNGAYKLLVMGVDFYDCFYHNFLCSSDEGIGRKSKGTKLIFILYLSYRCSYLYIF